jgi:chaperonin cofactor prefoldin
VGRATISGGGEDGLYTAAVNYNTKGVAILREAINKELEKITERLAEIQEAIDDLDKQISDRKSELKDLQDALHQEMQRVMNTSPQIVTHPESGSFSPAAGSFLPMPGVFLPSMPHDDLQAAMDATQAKMDAIPDITDPGFKKAMFELIEHMAGTQQLMRMITVLETERDFLLFREEALNKRLEELADAIEDGQPQAMWCADLTEDLEGEIDTIEIKGAPDQILIGPGGASGFAQNKLANIMAMSYAQAGLAWALLPGWQKWRPTYRVGRIHSIDYSGNTASVELDDSRSIAQNLAVNQAELAGITVDYMDCNAWAFENNDRVVVEFPGQLWEGAKVIGFESNPKSCATNFYACGYKDYAPTNVETGYWNENYGKLIKYNHKGEKQWEVDGGSGGAYRGVAANKDAVYCINMPLLPPVATTSYLKKLDPETGQTIWQISATGSFNAVAVSENYVIVGMGGGLPMWGAVDLYDFDGGYAGGFLWPGSSGYYPAVLAVDTDQYGYIYAANRSGDVFCFSRTGDFIWSWGTNDGYQVNVLRSLRDGTVCFTKMLGNMKGQAYRLTTGMPVMELEIVPAVTIPFDISDMVAVHRMAVDHAGGFYRAEEEGLIAKSGGWSVNFGGYLTGICVEYMAETIE